jgi:hypothetical protein
MMQKSTREFSRRRVLAAGLALGSIPWGAGQGRGAIPIEAEPIRTISSDDGYYCGWPTLAKRKSGELLVVYSGGRHAHVCPFGRVELIRSQDKGKTWSWPQTLLDSPIDDRDAGIVETSHGSLLVTTFTSLAYEPILQLAEEKKDWEAAELNRWRSAHRRLSAEQREAELGVWIMRSTDGGVSWSSRSRCLVNSPHGPIQLRDGRLLYAGKDLWGEGNRVGVTASDDDGQTWTWLADIPTRPGDDAKQYHELHAVETNSGRIVAHIRNHNDQNAREILQCHSTDGGLTWSTPRAIDVWGLPSFLLRLSDGRLLMSYGYRREPFGNQARISEDQGESWSEPISISDDGTSWDIGYPSTVQLDDGSLFTVWYERTSQSARTVLRGRAWKLL